MSEPERPLAVLGATGYTGRLVCAKARELGVPLRLVGRRRAALEEMARGEEVRVADARDPAALRAAFEGASVVASLAGPFLEVGFAPVAAAIDVGAHYLDTTGEQGFALRVYDEFGRRASERGVVLLTSFGFDYVPGDLAARLAADGLEPLDEVVVGYAVRGIAMSRGTRRTIGRGLNKGHMGYENGALVPSRFGATIRTFAFPFGESTAVEWTGTEPLTVPRHTQVRRVRSYVRAPKVVAAKARFAAMAIAPVVRASARVGSAGPSEERRRRNRFAVVAEARGPAGGRRATVAGSDCYGLTALSILRGAEALRAGQARGVGALAPAEAFDAQAFAKQLEPLLRVESVQEL